MIGMRKNVLTMVFREMTEMRKDVRNMRAMIEMRKDVLIMLAMKRKAENIESVPLTEMKKSVTSKRKRTVEMSISSVGVIENAPVKKSLQFDKTMSRCNNTKSADSVDFLTLNVSFEPW